MKDFDKFLSEAIQQKGKVLHSSIQKAIEFKNCQIKGNPQISLLTKVSNHKINTGEPSTTESSCTGKHTFFKMIEKNKEEKTTKLEITNLKKRKPIVEKLNTKLNANNSKTYSADTSETSNFAGIIVKQAKNKGKSSSTVDNSMQIVRDDMRSTDVTRIAGCLAESITLLREEKVSDNKSRKIEIFESILKFCEVCAAKSDEDHKQMVKRQLGSYLTAIYYLLLDLDDKKSKQCQAAIQAVSHLINTIKQKTLSYVN